MTATQTPAVVNQHTIVANSDGAKKLVEQMNAGLAEALGRHISVAEFTRIVLGEFSRNVKLYKCSRGSIFQACLDSAALGLSPSSATGHAYLVPFGNVCTLIPGYKGLVQLLYRSGVVDAVETATVRRGDVFTWHRGLTPALHHEPKQGEDDERTTNDGIAFYAIIRPNGAKTPLFDVMHRNEIEAVRQKSRGKDLLMWTEYFNEGGKKTVLRRLMKLAPQGTQESQLQIQRAIHFDNAQYDGGHSTRVLTLPDAEAEAEPEPEVEPEKPVVDERQQAAAKKLDEQELPSVGGDRRKILEKLLISCIEMKIKHGFETPAGGLENVPDREVETWIKKLDYRVSKGKK